MNTGRHRLKTSHAFRSNGDVPALAATDVCSKRWRTHSDTLKLDGVATRQAR